MVNYSRCCVNIVVKRDLRHFKALAWMVSALIYSGQLSLPAWEPYVPSRATKAQSVERRWRRFLDNQRVRVSRMYVPLVIAALNGWKPHRLYIALDTTVLWERYCMIHLSLVCCGRAVPLLWRVLEQANVPPLLLRSINRYCEKRAWLLRCS